MKEEWLEKWIEALRFEKEPVRFMGLLDCMRHDILCAMQSAGDQLLKDEQLAIERKKEEK